MPKVRLFLLWWFFCCNGCHHTLARELNCSLIKFNHANCFVFRSTCGSVRLSDRPTLGRNHMISTHRVVGHLLVLLVVHSLTHSLASLARSVALIRSLTHSLSWERGSSFWNECIDFIQFQPTVPWGLKIRLFCPLGGWYTFQSLHIFIKTIL